MSNKTELQNNNTEFRSNNTDLQTILDAVNALPESFSVNGIIEEYMVTAGDNISAGDFVQFVNSQGEYYGMLSDINQSGYKAISAVQLSENTIFVGCSYSNYKYPGACIVTVDGTTLTASAVTKLDTIQLINDISVVKLTDNKVLVIYCDSSYYQMVVVTINGTTLTAGSAKYFLGNPNFVKQKHIAAVAISETSVFMAYTYDSSNCYLHGTMIAIDGTTITIGSDTTISSTKYSGWGLSAVLLEENKVFLMHSDTSSYYLNGVIITISGTTFSAGTDTRLSSTAYDGYNISAILVDTNKVFIAHNSGGSSSPTYLYGKVVTIDGVSMTAGVSTQLSLTNYSANLISVAADSNSNKVFVAHNGGSNGGGYLYYAIASIDGTTVVAEDDLSILNSSSEQANCYSIGGSILEVNNSTMMIVHCASNAYLGGVAVYKMGMVTPYSDIINGVASTGGTGGDVIEVTVPA